MNKTLQLYDQTIHYQEYGTGKTLLLIHGFGLHSIIWSDILPELSKKYHIITLDLIGYGTNSNLIFDNSLQSQANYIHDFIKQYGTVDYVLGYSYGARVVFDYCFNLNTSVKKVIIVTPPFVKSVFFTIISRLCSLISHSYVASYSTRLVVSSWPLKNIIIGSYGLIEPSNAQVINRCIEIFRKEEDVKTMFKGVADLFRPYEYKQLTSIKPGYIFCEKDVIAPVTLARTLSTMLNSKTVTIIKNAFHLLPYEKPRELTDAVISLLAG